MASNTVTEIPQPVFDHRAYGVDLTDFGDEGGYAAHGHVDSRRFIAACNHYGRTLLGLRNMVDDRHVTAADMLDDIHRVWVLPVDPKGEFAWAVTWKDVTGDTPGAIPMTVWEPW